MNSPTDPKEMSLDDRLKAILYQYIVLHDRWAEERQAAAKQGADLADLLKKFTAQINVLKALESQVRRDIEASVQKAMEESTKAVSQSIHEAAHQRLEKTHQELEKTIEMSISYLNSHYRHREKSFYYYATVFFVGTVLVGFLVGKWATPDSYSPLTRSELLTYQKGLTLEHFWPHLSQKEKDRLIHLSELPPPSPNSDDGSNDSSSSDDNTQ